MEKSLSPIPLDLSGYRDAPAADIAHLLEKAAIGPEEPTLSAVSSLLTNRVLRLVRQGSRPEILEESLMLNRFLALAEESRLRQRRPETFGGWVLLAEMLSTAARSAGRAAIPSILSGSRGREILELLAGENRPLPRSEIRRRLDFKAESHLSHLLRDLEEADLVLRYRPEGSKEVVVGLGPAGKEHVTAAVLPAWIERLAAASSEIASGAAIDRELLSRQLLEAGAPSRLAAQRLAESLPKPSRRQVARRKQETVPERPLH